MSPHLGLALPGGFLRGAFEVGVIAVAIVLSPTGPDWLDGL